MSLILQPVSFYVNVFCRLFPVRCEDTVCTPGPPPHPDSDDWAAATGVTSQAGSDEKFGDDQVESDVSFPKLETVVVIADIFFTPEGKIAYEVRRSGKG